MTTRTLNGREYAALGAGLGTQCLVSTEREAANAASDPGRQRGAVAFSDAAALCSALATGEQKLGAALRLIDELRQQESLLKQNVALLTEAVAQARQFAYHDELTGLPNRRLLLDRFNQAIARAARQRKLVALLRAGHASAFVAVNTLGNALATIVVASWEGALDHAALRERLDAGPM